MVYGQELIRNDNTTWASRETIRSGMLNDIAVTSAIHRALKSGDPDYGLLPYIGVDPNQDVLLFNVSCTDIKDEKCQGLDALLQGYLETATVLATTPDAALSTTIAAYTTLVKLQNSTDPASLAALLDKSKSLFVNGVQPDFLRATNIVNALFGTSIPGILLMALFLRIPINRVRDNIRRTQYLLYMIDDRARRQMGAIQEYLSYGTLPVRHETAGLDKGSRRGSTIGPVSPLPPVTPKTPLDENRARSVKFDH